MYQISTVFLPLMINLKYDKCWCSMLSDVIYMDSQPEGFECTLVEIAVGNWVRLLRCSVCKQLWRIDALDKYQTQFAAKIPDIDSWQTYDSVPAIKQLLIQSRGGLSSNICQWAHCSQNAINGVAFCIDHLFDTGVRI